MLGVVVLILLLLVVVPMKSVETQVRKPQLSIDRNSDFFDCGYSRFPTMIAKSFSDNVVDVNAVDSNRHSRE